MPPGDRKSGIPAATLIPAPVRNAICFTCPVVIHSATFVTRAMIVGLLFCQSKR
eukprot:m.244869 g.244869  ORF g.244869 m.244869 type:complete len:54 (-) comp15356_c0_seq36:3998-4159(-)